MIQFLEILRCPSTGSPLRLADSETLENLNRAIAQRRIHDRLGRRLARELDGALVNADASLVYPIYDRIPSLVVDESIQLNQDSDEECVR